MTGLEKTITKVCNALAATQSRQQAAEESQRATELETEYVQVWDAVEAIEQRMMPRRTLRRSRCYLE